MLTRDAAAHANLCSGHVRCQHPPLSKYVEESRWVGSTSAAGAHPEGGALRLARVDVIQQRVVPLLDGGDEGWHVRIEHQVLGHLRTGGAGVQSVDEVGTQ